MSTWTKLVLAATIIFAAFLIAPVVDAAACAPETPAAHASVDHNPRDGDHGDRGGQHGLCSHGHCHHGSAARIGGSEAASPVFGAPMVQGRLHDDLRASIAPDGLKRPPRA